ncbi:MAG: ATP-dependent DNA helicase, partial [Deltaproteobacteria bacterium]|nr:ATP-dependent DNA helicase [Deltaproteobacteria bacterium]
LRGVLEARGASFFDELVDGARLVRAEAERGLAELADAGVVTADAFAGLRALLTPARLRSGPTLRRRSDPMRLALGAAGRWALVPRALAPATEAERFAAAEVVARTLLGRYGVFLRRVVDREGHAVGSVDLLRVLRRLEARGEVRGGRFVAGQSGEQYALPGVVDSLRALRRTVPPGEHVVVSAADPLNLSGVLVPGERIAAVGGHRILLRDGLPVAVRAGRGVALTTLGADLRPAEVERELLRPARDAARAAS